MRNASAVSIARFEYLRCPPAFPLGGAVHLLMASSVNQKVNEPRATRA